MGILIAGAVLLLDVMSLLDIFSARKDTEKKALWIVVILVLPIAGPILYFLLCRRGPLAVAGRGIVR